ncbi:MAG: hypothetical protein ACHQ3P_07775 [Candidatus Limnocylindrales bacterium]
MSSPTIPRRNPQRRGRPRRVPEAAALVLWVGLTGTALVYVLESLFAPDGLLLGVLLLAFGAASAFVIRDLL